MWIPTKTACHPYSVRLAGLFKIQAVQELLSESQLATVAVFTKVTWTQPAVQPAGQYGASYGSVPTGPRKKKTKIRKPGPPNATQNMLETPTTCFESVKTPADSNHSSHKQQVKQLQNIISRHAVNRENPNRRPSAHDDPFQHLDLLHGESRSPDFFALCRIVGSDQALTLPSQRFISPNQAKHVEKVDAISSPRSLQKEQLSLTGPPYRT